MAKLRHIALIVKEPKKLYEFYHSLFGLEQVRVSPSGSIHVIDGLFNLAFLQQKLGDSAVANTHRVDGSEIDQTQGINHYGFLVGSLEQALQRLPASVKRGESPRNGRPAEMRVIDPWGNKFDISSKGFLGREEKRLPGVRLVAVQAAMPEETARFYESVLEMRRGRTLADGTIMLTDGDVSLAITRSQTIRKTGIQYFGIQVPALKDLGIDLPTPSGAEGVFRLEDPEGNPFLVSERGW